MNGPLENGITATNNRLAIWWVPDESGPLSRKTTGKHAVLVVGEMGSRYKRAVRKRNQATV